MISFIGQRKSNLSSRIISGIIAFTFIFTMIMPPQTARAQMMPQSVLNLPAPGTMITPTNAFMPVIIKGVTIDPNNPLKFDFIVNKGDTELTGVQLKDESTKLIKYFLASLTVPEKEMWVNLSPYEKDRIIPEGLGVTNLGQDMLAQDYLLKQLTSSLVYPEDELGKKFWEKVYIKAKELYGTTDIPLNTFNKVWIIPQNAKVYVNGTSAFVVNSKLKVMLEEDYIALQKNLGNQDFGISELPEKDVNLVSGVSSQVIREVVIPAIEKEVNEGETFSNLRQIYNSMILATWYKQSLKETLLSRVYVNQNKTLGVDIEDKQMKEKIYAQYVEAFKKGVYNYIKEDYDPATQEIVYRKYFSGGINAPEKVEIETNAEMLTKEDKAMAALNLGNDYLVNSFVLETKKTDGNIAQVKTLGANENWGTPEETDLAMTADAARKTQQEFFENYNDIRNEEEVFNQEEMKQAIQKILKSLNKMYIQEAFNGKDNYDLWINPNFGKDKSELVEDTLKEFFQGKPKDVASGNVWLAPGGAYLKIRSNNRQALREGAELLKEWLNEFNNVLSSDAAMSVKDEQEAIIRYVKDISYKMKDDFEKSGEINALLEANLFQFKNSQYKDIAELKPLFDKVNELTKVYRNVRMDQLKRGISEQEEKKNIDAFYKIVEEIQSFEPSDAAMTASVLPRINPTTTESWKKLKTLAEDISKYDLRKAFENDPKRYEKMTLALSGQFEVDLSKNLIDQETLNALFSLANEVSLKEAMEKMFTGEKINEAEGRAVLHTALRNVKRDETGKLAAANGPVYVDGKDVMPDVIEVLEKMEVFTKKVLSGEWRGATGKKIKNVLNIGIGGSDLGPKMGAEALKPFKAGDVDAYFLSNIDGTAATELMKKLDPEETLIIVCSKTFTTEETIQNANTMKKWVVDHYKSDESVVKKHFVAVSTNKELVAKFGIDTENMFGFWDWVGGRYSMWSAVGLSLATFVGFDNFLQFLQGGLEADEHFRNQPFEKNIPVIKALLNVWYGNFLGADTFAILPYDQYMSLVPAFAQQFFMESNGKSADRSGESVDYETGLIAWGAAGTDGQHSFYQLIHQGTRLVPADFIGVLKTHNAIPGHHYKLFSNFVAQTEALGFGATREEIKAELSADPKFAGKDIDWEAEHRYFAGNKPTTSIIIDQVTPRTLGNLVAMYEQQIFVEGIIWNIFSFDQWGVELGKKTSNKKVSPYLQEKDRKSIEDLEASTLSSSSKAIILKFIQANYDPAMISKKIEQKSFKKLSDEELIAIVSQAKSITNVILINLKNGQEPNLLLVDALSRMEIKYKNAFLSPLFSNINLFLDALENGDKEKISSMAGQIQKFQLPENNLYLKEISDMAMAGQASVFSENAAKLLEKFKYKKVITIGCGVLTSGGLASGHNRLIYGIVLEAIRQADLMGKEIRVFGFENGWKGLFAKKGRFLTLDEVKYYYKKGGSFVKTERFNPYSAENIKKGVPEIMMKNLTDMDVDVFFPAGGDDTLGAAAKFKRDYPQFPMIGFAKTMDNDFEQIRLSYGFTNFVIAASEVAYRYKEQAKKTHSISTAGVFGRDSGFTTIGAGARMGAALSIIPEMESIDWNDIIKKVGDFYEKNGYAFVLAAEGVKVRIDEANKELFKQAFLENPVAAAAFLKEEIGLVNFVNIFKGDAEMEAAFSDIFSGKIPEIELDEFKHPKLEKVEEIINAVLKIGLEKRFPGANFIVPGKIDYAAREADILAVDANYTQKIGQVALQRFLEQGLYGVLYHMDPDTQEVLSMDLNEVKGGRRAQIKDGGAERELYVAANRALFPEEAEKNPEPVLESNFIDKFDQLALRLIEFDKTSAIDLDRIFVVEVGKNAGYTALELGAKIGATITLTPDQGPVNFGKLIKQLKEFYAKYHHAIVVVDEGVKINRDSIYFSRAFTKDPVGLAISKWVDQEGNPVYDKENGDLIKAVLNTEIKEAKPTVSGKIDHITDKKQTLIIGGRVLKQEDLFKLANRALYPIEGKSVDVLDLTDHYKTIIKEALGLSDEAVNKASVQYSEMTKKNLKEFGIETIGDLVNLSEVDLILRDFLPDQIRAIKFSLFDHQLRLSDNAMVVKSQEEKELQWPEGINSIKVHVDYPRGDTFFTLEKIKDDIILKQNSTGSSKTITLEENIDTFVMGYGDIPGAGGVQAVVCYVTLKDGKVLISNHEEGNIFVKINTDKAMVVSPNSKETIEWSKGFNGLQFYIIKSHGPATGFTLEKLPSGTVMFKQTLTGYNLKGYNVEEVLSKDEENAAEIVGIDVSFKPKETSIGYSTYGYVHIEDGKAVIYNDSGKDFDLIAFPITLSDKAIKEPKNDKAMLAQDVLTKIIGKTRRAKFGTSGDRGTEGRDFNMELVNRLAQGTAEYYNISVPGKIIYVVYDTRGGNKEYAIQTASILAGNGVKVRIIEEEATPTPVVTYLASVDDNVGGVINLTASHSPWMDRGFKISPDHGGAAPKEMTDTAQELANAATEYKIANYEAAKSVGLIEVMSQEQAVNMYVFDYVIPKLKEMGAWNDIVNYVKNNPDFHLVLDPMQGTSVEYMDVLYSEIGKAAGRLDFFELIHTNNKDPMFSEVEGSPRPDVLKHSKGLRERVASYEKGLGLSTDGDADRFGFVDVGGDFIPANDMIGMIAYFLKKEIGLKGALGATIATSGMVRAVADLLGEEFGEVAVGFKWFVEQETAHKAQMKAEGKEYTPKYLVAGEESAHVAIGPFMQSFDDGIAVGLMGLWMFARTGKGLMQYKDVIEQAIGKKYKMELQNIQNEQRTDEVKVGMTALHSRTVREIEAGTPLQETYVVSELAKRWPNEKVVRVNLIDGIKLILESGAWVVMRNSGTEPIVKLYAEVTYPYGGELDVEAKESLFAAVNDIVKNYKPEVDKAMAAELMTSTVALDEQKQGGINLDASLLNLQIKRDDNWIPLPVNQQPIESFRIDGFIPVIINITPINNLNMLLGFAIDEEESKTAKDSKDDSTVAPLDRRAKFELGKV